MGAHHVVAGCLLLLGIAHSGLGEVRLLRPLFAAEWSGFAGATRSRVGIERIFRLAWHFTSITWVALAAIALGADAFLAIAVICLVAAAGLFVAVRGHLAWPIFLLGGLAGIHATEALPSSLLGAAAIITIGALAAAALLHIYWAFGGMWFRDRAAPPAPTAGFEPGPLATSAVALALAAFALIVAFAAATEHNVAKWLAIAGTIVLVIRAVGDGRVVGFTKTDRSTRFAADDDRYFTPIIVLLAFGATSSVLL